MSDIRFHERTLTVADVSGFVDDDHDRRSTKSSKSRHIPIHQSLLEILQAKPRRDTHVFFGPRGGRLKPDTVRQILIREVIEPLTPKFPKPYPGVCSFEDGRLHSFRHYFCSTCANNGVPERMVMSWLGHSDSEMVRHYYHLSDEESSRKMNQLDLIGNGFAHVDPNADS